MKIDPQNLNQSQSNPVIRWWTTSAEFDKLAEQFYQETKVMAPGKDWPAEAGSPPWSYEERVERWIAWLNGRTAGENFGLRQGLDGRTMDLKSIMERVHKTAVEHGWWENENRNFGELMMLSVTELAEAFEEYRNGRGLAEIYFGEGGKPEGVPVEIADVFIRLMDNCEKYGIPLAQALILKMNYNDSRPYRHGGKLA